MTKTLLKKQLMEVFSWIFQDKKSGKIRSKSGIIGFSLLYLVLFSVLGSVFFTMAIALCEPLYKIGFGWLYFALMGLFAVALGVFGSVFNTYSSLYQAKDNDMLLSLPIPPSKILFAKLFGVYTMGLMYELIVMIPTIIVWFITVKVSISTALYSILSPFVLSVLVLVLACILGFVVAIVSGKLKRKNIVTVVLSLVFLAAYYYVYSQAYKMIGIILANPQKVGKSVKSILYPFYCMGRGAEGSHISMLIFIGIIALLFFAVYIVLARSFLNLVTANRGTTKRKYKEKSIKQSSVNGALLNKEFRRFLGSPAYMLNCGLGIVFMLIGTVVLIIKGTAFRGVIYEFFNDYKNLISLFTAAALCLTVSMCDMTAPSVSLEGKNIWLVKCLPISSFAPLKAKLEMHLLLTVPPIVLLAVVTLAVLKITILESILTLAVTVIFVLFTALLGLFLNIKMPNLTWTNEIVPIKQSMSVILTLFGGWAIVLLFGAIYFALRNFISPVVFLVSVSVILASCSLLLYGWLKTKGAKIFKEL